MSGSLKAFADAWRGWRSAGDNQRTDGAEQEGAEEDEGLPGRVQSSYYKGQGGQPVR